MQSKLKQAILEMLRMGEDPVAIQKSLEEAYHKLNGLKEYKPDHDIPDFYRALKDADHRP